MLFWDYWKLHHLDNVELVPGKPTWVPEGTYFDPHRRSGGTGRVYFDHAAGRWRKLTAYNQFYISESEDGIHWKPAAFPDLVPQGGKIAPHHVFTLPGDGPTPGWLYLDPVADDGPARRRSICAHPRRAAMTPTVRAAMRWSFAMA